MKNPSLSSRILLAVALVAATSLHAQTDAALAPLGLLRLKTATRTGDATPLPGGKFTVDDLSASGVVGASKGKRNTVDYLALDAGKEWSRPLRGNVRDVTFVSFQVYASQTTIIDIAGARLGLTAGPVANGLQVMFDDSANGALQWKPLNYHVSTGKYDGKNFAALPTLTVRLDPEAGTWDLYSGSRLLADNLPLIEAKKNNRWINIRAGTEGAWITGLVLADENPIYEDANANGIDDAFEKQQLGGWLLPSCASKADRQHLAQAWKTEQRKKAPPPFVVQRPLSDDLTASVRR